MEEQTDELGVDAVEAVRQAATRAAEWPSRERMSALEHSLARLARADEEWRQLRSLAKHVAALHDFETVPPALLQQARRLATGTLAPRGE